MIITYNNNKYGLKKEYYMMLEIYPNIVIEIPLFPKIGTISMILLIN